MPARQRRGPNQPAGRLCNTTAPLCAWARRPAVPGGGVAGTGARGAGAAERGVARVRTCGLAAARGQQAEHAAAAAAAVRASSHRPPHTTQRSHHAVLRRPHLAGRAWGARRLQPRGRPQTCPAPAPRRMPRPLMRATFPSEATIPPTLCPHSADPASDGALQRAHPRPPRGPSPQAAEAVASPLDFRRPKRPYEARHPARWRGAALRCGPRWASPCCCSQVRAARGDGGSGARLWW